MISTLKVQSLETGLIEKIKQACRGKGQAAVSQKAQEAGKTLADYSATLAA